MAASSSNNVTKTLAEHLLDGKPQWLENFLAKPYFKPCLLHGKTDLGYNINKFCVDCRTHVCPSCILEFGHTGHAIIQVFRHVYQDAASVKAIKSFMNIDDIQTYKSNQALVVALRPLLSVSKINHVGHRHNTVKLANPNSRIKPSGSNSTIKSKVTSSLTQKNQIERRCQVCGKRLVPLHQFNYCSIQCKLIDYMNKSDHSTPPFLLSGGTEKLGEADSNVNMDGNEKADGPPTRRRKRKGIPHRAPFF